MFEKCRGPFEFHWSGIRHGWRPQRFGMCFVVLMRSNRRGLSFLHWSWYRYVSTVSMAKPNQLLGFELGLMGCQGSIDQEVLNHVQQGQLAEPRAPRVLQSAEPWT